MNIGVWGDSVVAGVGDEAGLGWVGRLHEALVPAGSAVHNYGIPGDTSKSLLRRFEREASEVRPDTILIAIGGNDSRHLLFVGPSLISIKKFRHNIEQLVAQAKHIAQRVIIVGIGEVGGYTIRPWGIVVSDKTLYRYDVVLRDIAEREGLEFIDMHGVLTPITDFSDGLHPNASGYQKMFERILSIF